MGMERYQVRQSGSGTDYMKREQQEMNLRFEELTAEGSAFDQVKALYEASFLENERKPFLQLMGGLKGAGEVYAVYDDTSFIGMISLLTLEDITHILYLAVKPEFRDRGYGSGILSQLRRDWTGQRIIADLETPEDHVPNYDERKRRVAFYRKNGYSFTEISYRWENEDYRVMSNGGNVTGEEFGRFWRHFLH